MQWRLDKIDARPQDLATALALLTCLPINARFERTAQAAWAYPVAGCVVALLAGGCTWLALLVGVPAQLAAFVWVGGCLLLTGGLHEDGLADTADGLGGGKNAAHRLDIMRDSRVGSFGVMALVLGLGARVVAVGMILQSPGWLAALLAVAMVSRATMPCLMAALPAARRDGLSYAQGRVPPGGATLAVAVAGLLALVLVGFIALALVLVAAGVTMVMGAIAQARVGGQSGDILGACQQCSEVALLMALL